MVGDRIYLMRLRAMAGIMIRVVLSLLFITGFAAKAQSVAPLFPVDAYLTNVAVPFEVKGTQASDIVKIVSLSPVANTGSCKSLIDPYRPQIFHVRCTKGGSVIYKVAYQRNGVLEAMTLPSISVTAPTGNVINPDPGPEDPTEDPDIARGRTLADSYCVGCHHTHQQLRGRTATQITNAINKFAEMGHLKSLTTTQRNQISKFLRSL